MSSSPEIRQRLLSIEREFIPILSGDDVEAAVAFSQRWSQLHADVEAALHTNSLDDETSALAHSIGSKISISADLFLSFRTISGNVTDQLERMFDDRLNLDAPAPPHPNAPDLVPTITRPDASLPSYIEPAYRWLLKHLHNPYPSKDVKQKFADETGSTVERISDWFVDVRRRMGWTLLLREEFGRKRNDMIDAARRFYISPDRRYPLSPDIHGRFVEMEAYAHEMYAAKFLPSALSTKLTTAVKDLTPELQEKARKERWEKLQAQREAAKYPSPVSSGASSPISDPGASTSLAGRKRSSSEASDDYDSFRKRSRNDDGSEGVALPSPPDSRDSTPTFTSIPSRKRRLSDADTAGAAKRPRNRATSDPIPVTVTLAGTPHILADWYSSDREGDTNLFESGQLLDIKFFDPSEYEIPLDTPAAPSEPVLRDMTPFPQNTIEPEMLTFELPMSLSFENENFFDFPNYVDDLQYQPSPSPEFAPYAPIEPYPTPVVYEPPSFFDVDASGHGYNNGYITQESVAESFGLDPMPSHDSSIYSAFPDGKTPSNIIDGFEQQHKSRNDYSMYLPANFATS